MALSRSSQRNIPVLLGRIAVPLSPQGPEGLDQPGPGVTRVYHIVDVTPLRRGKRVSELLGVLLDEPAGRNRRITGARYLLLEEDLDRSLGPHDRDLGRWPCEVDIPADVLRAHHI